MSDEQTTDKPLPEDWKPYERKKRPRKPTEHKVDPNLPPDWRTTWKPPRQKGQPRKAPAVSRKKLMGEALYEERVEQIADLMRQVSNEHGRPAWNRKKAREFATAWGLTRNQMVLMAKDASKRIAAEVDNPEALINVTAATVLDLLAKAHADGNARAAVYLSNIALIIAKRAGQIETNAQQEKNCITPAQLADIVRSKFGDKVERVPAPGQDAGSPPTEGSDGPKPLA